MSQADKLVEEFCACSGSFPFRDFVRMLNNLGYALHGRGKTGGSRRRFIHRETGHKIFLHEPHGGDDLGPGTVKLLRAQLKDKGVL